MPPMRQLCWYAVLALAVMSKVSCLLEGKPSQILGWRVSFSPSYAFVTLLPLLFQTHWRRAMYDACVGVRGQFSGISFLLLPLIHRSNSGHIRLVWDGSLPPNLSSWPCYGDHRGLRLNSGVVLCPFVGWINLVKSRLPLNHMATRDHWSIVGGTSSSGPWVLASLVFYDLLRIASLLVSSLVQVVYVPSGWCDNFHRQLDWICNHKPVDMAVRVFSEI